MNNPSYLVLSRHNIYYFRWAILAPYRLNDKKAFIKLSLDTRNPKDALRLSKMLEYHAAVLLTSESVAYMDDADIRNAILILYTLI